MREPKQLLLATDTTTGGSGGSENHKLKVNIQLQNCRIYVGNIPKRMNKDQLIQEFSKFVQGVVDCVVYNTPEYANRGFCFLDFDSHKAASDAKRQLPDFPLFGQQKQVITKKCFFLQFI